MTLPPSVRKALLTTHLMSSVGWFGAVACFLVLAIVGVESASAELVRGSYLAMQVLTWSLIVPLCLASLVTGILQALGTPWGLLRHYWVITKLVLTVVATLILLMHTQPIGAVATRAAAAALAFSDLRGVRIQLIGDAGAALLVLLVTTILSVYKPRGMTRYGWRRQHEGRAPLTIG
jgi:hypothetical protein